MYSGKLPTTSHFHPLQSTDHVSSPLPPCLNNFVAFFPHNLRPPANTNFNLKCSSATLVVSVSTQRHKGTVVTALFYALNLPPKQLYRYIPNLSSSATHGAHYHILPKGIYTLSIQKFYKLFYRDCTDVSYKTVSRGLPTM